jgi:hypothetical protein
MVVRLAPTLPPLVLTVKGRFGIRSVSSRAMAFSKLAFWGKRLPKETGKLKLAA